MRKIALKYGLWMFAGFTAFFLLMHLVGASTNPWFRIFNGAIHFGLMTAAIYAYRRLAPNTITNYVSGVIMGIWTSAVGVLAFVVFMLLFMALNPAFMEGLRASAPGGGYYLTPITGTLFILAEGIAVSLIGSYIVTRVVDMRLTDQEALRRRRIEIGRMGMKKRQLH